MTGRFITFEGGEGGGKSTQAAVICEWLIKQNIDAVRTREMGGTPEAEMIRTMFLSDDGAGLLPFSQAMLAYTARHEHTEQMIKPALSQGRWVVSDRYNDSSLVYQCLKGVSRDKLLELQQLTIGSFEPDLTILFDIDPDLGFARLDKSNRTRDRFENSGAEYHRRVRDMFCDLAAAHSGRFVTVDASQPLEVVTEALKAIISKRFDLPG